MSKKDHDNDAALHRPVSYDKSWFLAAKAKLFPRLASGMKILDFCCGNGDFSELIRQSGGGG
jgi:ubiquinone/menaquinone biosynthesis C-methylase UbiE